MKKILLAFVLLLLSDIASAQRTQEALVSLITQTNSRLESDYKAGRIDACAAEIDSIESWFGLLHAMDSLRTDSLLLFKAYYYGVKLEKKRGNRKNEIRRNVQLCHLADSKLETLIQGGLNPASILKFWINLWELYTAAERHEEALAVAQYSVGLCQELPEYLNAQLNRLGISYSNIGDYEMSSHCYEIILEEFNSDSTFLRAPKDYYVVMANLGKTYNRLGKYRKGLELLTSPYAHVIEKYARENDRECYLYLLRSKFNIMMELGELQDAGPLVRQILEQTGEEYGKSSLQYGESLNNLLEYHLAYLQLHPADTAGKNNAMADYSETVAFWESYQPAKTEREYLVYLNDKALYTSVTGDKEASLAAYRELISLQEKNGNIPVYDKIQVLTNYAITLKEAGNWQDSELCLFQTLDICKKEDLMRSETCARIFRTLSEIYLTQYNNTEYAEIYANISYGICSNLKNAGLENIYCLKQLAIISSTIGNYERSLNLQLQAIREKKRLGIPLHPEDWLTCASACQSDSLVLPIVEFAIDIMEKNGDYRSKAHALVLKGKGLTGLGKYEEAEECLTESLRIRKEGSDTTEIAYSLEALANLYTIWNKTEKAELYALEACRLLPMEPMTRSNLSAVYYVAGEQEKFESLLPVLYEDDKNNIRNAFRYMDSRQREAFVSSDHGYTHSFLAFPSRFPESDICAGYAYDMALVEKGLLLSASRGFQSAAAASKDPKIKEGYREWMRLSEQLSTEHDSVDQEWTAHRISMLEKALRLELADNVDKDIFLTWKDVSNSLPDNGIAIEFAEASCSDNLLAFQSDSTRLAAIVVRKGWNAPRYIPLAESATIRNILAQGALAYSREYSTLLYDAVFRPICPYISSGDTVFFSPAGLMHQLNLEILVNEDGKELCEIYKMERVSSTRSLCQKPAHVTAKEAILFGGLAYDAKIKCPERRGPRRLTRSLALEKHQYPDSIFRYGVEYLEKSLEEVEAISRILGKKKYDCHVYSGEQGTEECFKGLSGTDASILHVATHGFYIEDAANKRLPAYLKNIWSGSRYKGADAMQRSGLVLAGGQAAWVGDSIPAGAEDGILLAEEIARMDLSGIDIVGLSACQTGLGEITDDGVVGLQRAFKNAGVQSIIMSLWKVDDAAASRMMQTFYQEYSKGRSKTEAFKTAREIVRKEWPEPVYWAGFLLLDPR